ncbi:Uncharacterised protein [Mycobacteroides abscessus subsp. abscessus]|nr:Uncharacterised protein [Mycobacteroides abscessus subsp. abscessus]
MSSNGGVKTLRFLILMRALAVPGSIVGILSQWTMYMELLTFPALKLQRFHPSDQIKLFLPILPNMRRDISYRYFVRFEFFR